MKATITSKGQVTIPQRIRERLGLKAGDLIEFDEKAPVLVARRVVDRGAWQSALGGWGAEARRRLKGHPWEKLSSGAMIDELRGGPADKTRPRK